MWSLEYKRRISAPGDHRLWSNLCKYRDLRCLSRVNKSSIPRVALYPTVNRGICQAKTHRDSMPLVSSGGSERYAERRYLRFWVASKARDRILIETDVTATMAIS